MFQKQADGSGYRLVSGCLSRLTNRKSSRFMKLALRPPQTEENENGRKEFNLTKLATPGNWELTSAQLSSPQEEFYQTKLHLCMRFNLLFYHHFI